MKHGALIQFPFPGQLVHRFGIARGGRQRGAIHQCANIGGYKYDRRTIDLNTRGANALHFPYARNRPKLVRHGRRKAEAASGQAGGWRDEEIGIERHSEPGENGVVTRARQPTQRNN